jgi:hypothetical protein
MTRRKRWLIWIAAVIVLAAIGYLTGWWDKAARFSHRVMALGLHSTVVTPVHDFVVAMFDNPTTTAAVVSVGSACFAFFTLLVQFFVGSRQAKASRISADAAMLTAKSSGNRAVASMRIKWVEDLRSVLSDYHSMLMTRETFESEDRGKMSNLGTKLDLMMNLNESDQRALWEIADKIYFEEDVEKRREHDKAMMDAARLVLKNEWEKIKRELRGD